ncbi:MAG TPA: LysM peptidoglycan-binding domain-containing protein [Clostridiales bacterium]|nr:LysM peptidoglycan-binding domain-containing protein [Clostridiales bacterium]
MEIYVVQQGDTIDSIASGFGVSVERLVIDNGINASDDLVVGQTLVITHPTQTYTVKEGDTLGSIAEAFQVPVMQLLRNNPYLADREYLYPGETLVISFDNNNGSLWVDGYAYSFIDDSILRMTLPYLTSLLILNYRSTGSGGFIGDDQDISVIRTAGLYETTSSLVITAYSATGAIDTTVIQDVLLNPRIQEILIENLLEIVKAKGYDSVNMAFQLITTDNQQYYLDFIERVSIRLHAEGYPVYLTINPGVSFNGKEVAFERLNYSEFSRVSDGILFLSYDWGSVQRPPTPFSIVSAPALLDYIVSQVPLDKIRTEIPTLGYDWKLPYVPGVSRANALNFHSVLTLARETNSVINYDETILSAYFQYTDFDNLGHIVWFKDARSIDASLKLLKSYGIRGIGIWNIMYYFDQLWLVVNTQYEIEKP